MRKSVSLLLVCSLGLGLQLYSHGGIKPLFFSREIDPVKSEEFLKATEFLIVRSNPIPLVPGSPTADPPKDERFELELTVRITAAPLNKFSFESSLKITHSDAKKLAAFKREYLDKVLVYKYDSSNAPPQFKSIPLTRPSGSGPTTGTFIEPNVAAGSIFLVFVPFLITESPVAPSLVFDFKRFFDECKQNVFDLKYFDSAISNRKESLIAANKAQEETDFYLSRVFLVYATGKIKRSFSIATWVYLGAGAAGVVLTVVLGLLYGNFSRLAANQKSSAKNERKTN